MSKYGKVIIKAKSWWTDRRRVRHLRRDAPTRLTKRVGSYLYGNDRPPAFNADGFEPVTDSWRLTGPWSTGYIRDRIRRAEHRHAKVSGRRRDRRLRNREVLDE